MPRVWLSGVRVLVLLVVWLTVTHVYVRREFESRSRHKSVFAIWVALLYDSMIGCRKEEHVRAAGTLSNVAGDISSRWCGLRMSNV